MSSKKRSETHLPFVANLVGDVVFTIGAETGGNTRNIGLQLKDHNGNDVTEPCCVDAYISDDADGSTLAGTAPSTGISIGTDGLLITQVTNKAFKLISEADGDIDLNIVEASADTWYLVVVLPSGKLVISDAIIFA